MAMRLSDDLPDYVVGVRAIGEVDDDDQAFGWLIPGEVRVFHLDELETARTWITA